MLTKVTISIFEVVGSALCVASDDGQKVHDRISLALEQGREVVLSFHNVSVLTSAFLNAAVGQLYGKFDWALLSTKLSAEDIDSSDRGFLKWVIESAKQYYSDPDMFSRAFQDEMESDDSHVQD